MTNNNLTSSFCLALLLASPLAGAEAQYPAADFEPVIISQDPDLIAKHSQAAKERAQAKPQPAQSAKQNQAAAEQAKADIGTPPEKALSKQEDSAMENFPIALIILTLAGFVFWSSKRSGSEAPPPVRTSVSSVAGPAGDTGVARYLKALEEAARKAAGSGVSRYLKRLESSIQVAARPPAQETGVARYLKNQQR